MAVRRKGIFNNAAYGSAPMPQRPGAPMAAPPQMGSGGQQTQAQSAPPPQPMQQPQMSSGGPMTPMNVDPFLTQGGPMEDQVDPLTILSLLQSKGLL